MGVLYDKKRKLIGRQEDMGKIGKKKKKKKNKKKRKKRVIERSTKYFQPQRE